MINQLSGAVSIIRKPPAADRRGLKTNAMQLSVCHLAFPVHDAFLTFHEVIFQFSSNVTTTET